MRTRYAIWLFFLLRAISPAYADETSTWAYVTAFRSGAIQVVDVGADRIVGAFRVEDRDGMIGLAVTSDGKRLLVVDGNDRSRLRILDTMSGHTTFETAFQKRRLRPAGLPVISLTSDDRLLFVQTQSGVRVFDVQAQRFFPRPLRWARCPFPFVVGGTARKLMTLCPHFYECMAAVFSRRSDFAATARTLRAIADVAAAAVMRDASQLLAVAAMPPERTLPRSKPLRVRPGAPTPAPTALPNPALREGPWRLEAWRPNERVSRRIDLIHMVDVEKLTPTRLPALATSPDNRWFALLFGTRAYVFHPDTLQVQWEIYLPDACDGAAFTADSQGLLTVDEDGSLLLVHMANRACNVIVPRQLRTARYPIVVAAPRPG